MKRKVVITSGLFLSTLLLTGCNLFGSGGSGDVDSTKTQIGISNYGGGYGTEWLEALTAKYAEKVKDVEFEPGKKGVQFTLNQEKEHRDTVAKIKGLTSIDIVFDEGIQYNMWATSDCFKDITEIVNAENPYDGGKTIASKMSGEQQESLLKNGKYYAMPSYTGSYGITYNQELLDSNSLYFKDGGGWTNASGKLTKGPDGIAGTYDDGLPVTQEDFMKLCRQAKTKGLVPLVAAGKTAPYYIPAFLLNYAACYEGSDIAKGRFSSSSQGVPVVDLEDPSKVENIDITPSNGYDFFRTEGFYKAFTLLDNLFSIKNGDSVNKDAYMIDYADGISSAFNTSITHKAMQKYFVEGCRNGKNALMMIEGDWWFNEGIEYIESAYKGDYSKAKFGWMPLPRKSEGNDSVYYNSLSSYCYVREGIDASKQNAVKDFLLYAYSDEALNDFTKITNTRWGLDYSLTSEVRSSLHPFGQSLNAFYESEKTHIIPSVSQDPFFIKNEGSLVVYHSDYIKLNNASNIVNYLYDERNFTTTGYGYMKELYNVWKKKSIWG